MRRPALLLVPVLVLAVVSVGLVSAATITGTTSGTVVWDSPNGPTIETTNIDVNESVPIRQSVIDLGHSRFSGTGEAALSDGDLKPDEIKVTAVDSGSGELVVNRTGLQAVGLTGTASSLTVRQVDLNAETPEIETTGANGTVRVTGLSANAGFIVLRDGAISQFNDTDSGGNLTLSVSGDETISIRTPNAPQITNVTPAGGTAINQKPVPLQVDVDWELFGLDPSAKLNLNWSINGQQVTTGTLTSAATATVDVNVSDGLALDGLNTWSLTVTDAAGDAPSKSVSEQFEVPNKLEIRDELNPNKLVNNATVELTFFGSDEDIITRTSANGTIDMTGLPLSQSFSVSADAPGYVGRTTFIPSILEQQRVFLLNSSQTNTVETQFELSDPTGQFTVDSARVEIQKALEINGTTEFRTVVGDRLGSPAFSTVLEQGARYGITVFDGQGNQRELGPYEATSPQLVNLEIDDVQLGGSDFTDTQQYRVGADFVNDSVPSIQTVIEPLGAVKIDRFEYRIYPRGNESNEIANETIINLQGTLSDRTPIPSSIDRPDLETFVFEFSVTANGTTTEGSELIGSSQSQVAFGGIPTTILHAVGMGMILLVGGLFSQANVGVGAIATSLVAGGLWFIGALPASVSGIAIALALLLGVLTFARSRGRTPTP